MTDNFSIGISDFARKRHTAESPFTHFEIVMGWSILPDMVRKNWDKRRPGYRDGVVLVPVDPEGFFCGVVQLKEGDKFVGSFTSRDDGEEPRKSIYVCSEGRTKSPCKCVDIVLYAREILEERDEPRTGADWDIITLLGNIVEGDMPMSPTTLIANHFQLSGGTATKMSPEKFEAALRESVLYWKDKAMLAPSP